MLESIIQKGWGFRHSADTLCSLSGRGRQHKDRLAVMFTQTFRTLTYKRTMCNNMYGQFNHGMCRVIATWRVLQSSSTRHATCMSATWQVLSDPDMRAIYDEMNGYAATGVNPFSDTRHERDHAFVDEFSCIGGRGREEPISMSVGWSVGWLWIIYGVRRK